MQPAELAVPSDALLAKLDRGCAYALRMTEMPKCFEQRFGAAAAYFEQAEIPYYRMGICEESGDLCYQLLKMVGARIGALTEEDQQRLFQLRRDSLQGTDVCSFYGEALMMVNEDYVSMLRKELPRKLFSKEEALAREFLASQYVAYASRKVRQPHEQIAAFQSAEYVINTKIPEETAELLDVLVRFRKNLSGLEMVKGMRERMHLGYEVASAVVAAITDSKRERQAFCTLEHLIGSTIGMRLEDCLRFSLFKIRGRQELNFNGVVPEEVTRVCKPAEYLIEAYLVASSGRG
jgi:hypothetical protein